MVSKVGIVVVEKIEHWFEVFLLSEQLKELFTSHVRSQLEPLIHKQLFVTKSTFVDLFGGPNVVQHPILDLKSDGQSNNDCRADILSPFVR